jgi:transcriptional regulator with XRE-family HTH domain
MRTSKAASANVEDLMTQPIAPRTKLQRSGHARAREQQHAIAAEVRRARDDAGLSQRRIAYAAGVSQGTLSEIETGEVEPTLEVLARIAAALGGEISVRINPGTGPLIRDDIQAAMVQALLPSLHPRWKRFLEVAVHQPVRGVIDLVMHDPDEPALIAGEAQSELRRIEQQVRWSKAKADALATGGARELAEVLASYKAREAGTSPTVSRVLLLRSTRATRHIVATYADLLAAAYPAKHTEVIAAMTGTAPWPGPGLAWMDVSNGTASLRHEPPRGIRLGR